MAGSRQHAARRKQSLRALPPAYARPSAGTHTGPPWAPGHLGTLPRHLGTWAPSLGRRGAEPADIQCISFSHDLIWLLVSSDHGTVHLFRLGDEAEAAAAAAAAAPPTPTLQANSAAAGGGDSTPDNPRSNFAFLGGLLPKAITPTYFQSQWSFAQFRLPGSEKNLTPSATRTPTPTPTLPNPNPNRYPNPNRNLARLREEPHQEPLRLRPAGQPHLPRRQRRRHLLQVQLRPRQGRRLHARGLAALSHTRGGRVSWLESDSRWQAPRGPGEVAAPRSAR